MQRKKLAATDRRPGRPQAGPTRCAQRLLSTLLPGISLLLGTLACAPAATNMALSAEADAPKEAPPAPANAPHVESRWHTTTESPSLVQLSPDDQNLIGTCASADAGLMRAAKEM